MTERDFWRLWGVVLFGAGIAAGLIAERFGAMWWRFEGILFASSVGVLVARWGR